MSAGRVSIPTADNPASNMGINHTTSITIDTNRPVSTWDRQKCNAPSPPMTHLWRGLGQSCHHSSPPAHFTQSASARIFECAVGTLPFSMLISGCGGSWLLALRGGQCTSMTPTTSRPSSVACLGIRLEKLARIRGGCSGLRQSAFIAVGPEDG